MSASSKKKLRKLQEQDSQQSTHKASKMSKQTKETILVICIAVVLLAALAAGMMIYSNQKLKPNYDVSVAAGTVGEEKVSVPMMNYFYMDAVSSFYSQYSSYVTLFFDPTKALNEQKFNNSLMGSDTEYATWDDYFIDQAKSRAAETFNLYVKAQSEGYTLTEEESKQVDSSLDTLKDNASKGGFKNATAYLSTLYGPGCDVDNYREYLTIEALTSRYYSDGVDAITVSDDEITDAYAEDPSAYDRITYYIYTAKPETKTDDDGNTIDPTDEEIEAAKADAASMKDNFQLAKATRQNYQTKEGIGLNYSEDVASWLFDASRKAGDVESFESTTSANTTYVVQFVERDDLDYDTANIKILKINLDSTDDSSDDSESKEAKEPAIDRFNAIWDKLNANPTEENFEQLVADSSEDTTTNTNKGEKLNVSKTTFSAEGEITAWLFNAKHNAGDFQKFENETTGYYIVWFTGYGENYRHQSVSSAVKTEKQSTWYDSVAKVSEFTADDTQIKNMRTGITLSNFFSTSSSSN